MSCDFMHPVQRTHYEEGKNGIDRGKKKEQKGKNKKLSRSNNQHSCLKFGPEAHSKMGFLGALSPCTQKPWYTTATVSTLLLGVLSPCTQKPWYTTATVSTPFQITDPQSSDHATLHRVEQRSPNTRGNTLHVQWKATCAPASLSSLSSCRHFRAQTYRRHAHPENSRRLFLANSQMLDTKTIGVCPDACLRGVTTSTYHASCNWHYV